MKIVNADIEDALVKNVAAGSSEAFTTLFDHYKHIIYSQALHFTQSVFIAEEITQDVFLKCWLNKTSLPEIENLQAWLFTITKNLCFNHLKKIAREHQFKTVLASAGEQTDEQVESYINVKEQQQLLHRAIDHLSDKQKLVYTLNRDGGMKNAEIAARLNCSPNTVKTHMVSALRSIRIYFKEHTESAVQVLLIIFLLK